MPSWDKGQRVTNLRHESVFLGEFERHALRLLDGGHDRASLVAALAEAAASGQLTVAKGGQAVRDAKQVQEMIADALEQQLRVMARNALLLQ